MTSADETRLRHVLDGLSYPAQKWQIVTWADFYGADATTRNELAGLPTAAYRGVDEIIAAVAGTRGRPRRSGADRILPTAS